MSSPAQPSKEAGLRFRRAPITNISLGGPHPEATLNSGCDLAGGVRGMSGAITMERSEDEKLKFPDRINLDRKGLHGVPILEDEPGLRLLSLQHNFIKRIQHLDATYRLVFLDLYHNRLDVISNLEPLINLRVLMLGKNRIRRIEALQKCHRLSVLDLHGNRITQITGLETLSDLKVLNLAGNLIRKISGLQGLISLEELNIRRNRIRTTVGMETIPTLEKLYMSNNEIQNVASLTKLEVLVKLHTVQMEGNPVWSNTEYAYHLVTTLPDLKVLDQQEISSEVRANASKWKEAQQVQNRPPSASGAQEQLMKKMEERNVAIVNAKERWNFLKTHTWKPKSVEDEGPSASPVVAKGGARPKVGLGLRSPQTQVKDQTKTSSSKALKPLENTLSPSLNRTEGMSGSGLSRQASKTNLALKLAIPGVLEASRSSPGSPTVGSKSLKADLEARPIKNEHLRKKFPGLERRKFALPQRFVSLQENSSDLPSPSSSRSKGENFASMDKKIGFFLTPQPEDAQSTSEELSGIGLLSESSSESSSSDVEEAHLAIFPPQALTQSLTQSKRTSSSTDATVRRNASMTRLSKMDGSERSASRGRLTSAQSKASTPNLVLTETGRTSEQGRDYLIELDGDLLSVYGAQSLKFLDRPWNRQRAQKASTVQFNFVSFDDLVQYLPKFRQNFSNVENFEFLETDIHCLGQLNALGLVQGITSLFIGEEGNGVFHKDWKTYAIYRLEHWGLQYINNVELTEEDILKANQTYGSVGELAIMVLPQSQILTLVKKFELAGSGKDLSNEANLDVMSLIKDPTVKEIVAKESLQYKPKNPDQASEDEKTLKAMSDLLEVGHSAFHKLGRLEQEWETLLPILIKRILTQYSDLRQYKKDSLVKLEKADGKSRLAK